MRSVAVGFNSYLNKDFVESDIQMLDGIKIDSLDIYINEIESQDDVDKIIQKLNVVKYCLQRH